MERYQDLKSELIDWLWEQAEEVRQGTITPEHLTQLQEWLFAKFEASV